MSKNSSLKEISKGSFDAAFFDAQADVNYIGVLQKSSVWIRTKFLGSGSYGSVHLATNRNGINRQYVAIKTTEISRASSLMDEIRKECWAGFPLHSSCNHALLCTVLFQVPHVIHRHSAL